MGIGINYEDLWDFVTLPFKSSEEESVRYMGGFLKFKPTKSIQSDRVTFRLQKEKNISLTLMSLGKQGEYLHLGWSP